jgi:lycopene beta-cyclase
LADGSVAHGGPTAAGDVAAAGAIADVVILGGGLSGCLTALAYGRHRPEDRVVLVEAAPVVAGNHTWCCFATDLDGADALTRRLLDELIAHRWPRHRVRFPGFDRALEVPYLCVTADRLREAVARDFVAPPRRTLLTGARVLGLEPGADRVAVHLADGRRLDAGRVLDARGGDGRGDGGGGAGGRLGRAPAPHPPSGPGARPRAGYQKFLGREVTLRGWTELHGDTPLVMDATVPQTDGFRFMYVLPLGPDDRVLLEDTSFSDRPDLDLDLRREAIDAYAAAMGVVIERVHREEAGVLPMPWILPEILPAIAPAPTSPRPRVEAIGYAGGLFHAGTGYSLAIAATAAVTLATSATTAGQPVDRQPLDTIRRRLREQNRYFALLNRLMFVGLPPAERWRILERFYRLPPETILRFYGARTTRTDRARILLGRPPRGFRWGSLLAESMHPETYDLADRPRSADPLKEAT